ncbi:MAG: hypothetical protein ABIS14_15565, partial [Sphingomonas sp.]
MTTLQLLGAILATLLIEISLVISLFAWRRRAIAPPSGDASRLRAAEPLAWEGTRPFQITRRAYEDRAQSQCSFYLSP